MAASNPKSSKPCLISKWLTKLSFPGLRRHTAAKLPAEVPAATQHSSCRTGGGGKFLEAFRRFDANGDGKISSSELQYYFAWVGESIAVEEAERVIADLDADGDGLMDYDDFVRLMKHGKSSSKGGGSGDRQEELAGRDHEHDDDDDDDLKGAFSMFEAEKGSGRITAAGLRRALSRLGDMKSEEECAAMIRAYDLDGDGVLVYDEFYRMMMA